MKVVTIKILTSLKDIDIENDNVDVYIEVEDGCDYTLSFATPRNIQFLMDKEKMESNEVSYEFLSGYPFIVVNKLTLEIIEEAVKAFAEEANGYWLKTYHFGGSQGIIDEVIFNQIKAKHIEERKEFAKLDALDLRRGAKSILEDPVKAKDLILLVEQYRSGNTKLALKIRAVPGTDLRELRAKSGARIYFQEKNGRIEVVAISNKNNQIEVIETLKLYYEKK